MRQYFSDISSILLIQFFLLFTQEWVIPIEARRNGKNNFSQPNNFYGRNGGLRSTEEESTCERITVPMCMDIGYNMTDISFSIMNKMTQDASAQELNDFKPLILLDCSPVLKQFLCSLYVPICMPNYRKFVPPCKFICDMAKRGCSDVMKKYNGKWPESLRCDRFPKYSTENQICMDFNLTKNNIRNKGEIGKHVAIPTTTHVITQEPKQVTTKVTPSSIPTYPSTYKTLPIRRNLNHNVCICECHNPMEKIYKGDPMYNKVTSGGVTNCAMPCHSPYFSATKRNIAKEWITIWSFVCFVTTFMTVCTFLIDLDRVQYPERPIVFIAACCMFVSIGFLIRILTGHERTACSQDERYIIYRSTGQMPCSLVFILIYFFSMASSLWWVILTFTWFLAAGLKWGKEAISNYSQYYHAIAWLVPAVLTVTVLATTAVDGDSLSGICLVGNQNPRSLRAFIIVPLVVYLMLGGLFLLSGVISLFRIRTKMKSVGEKTGKLDKLMIRIGIFSLLYMIPSLILLGCYFYEHNHNENWQKTKTCRLKPVQTAQNLHKKLHGMRVKKFSILEAEKTSYSFMFHNIHNNLSSCQVNYPSPNFILFMVRYLMMLLVGVTNGVWICSKKTILSWKQFYKVSTSWCKELFYGSAREMDEKCSSVVSSKQSKSTNNQANTEQDIALLEKLGEENILNSRSDTCLFGPCCHHTGGNIHSTSAPDVVTQPISNIPYHPNKSLNSKESFYQMKSDKTINCVSCSHGGFDKNFPPFFHSTSTTSSSPSSGNNRELPDIVQPKHEMCDCRHFQSSHLIYSPNCEISHPADSNFCKSKRNNNSYPSVKYVTENDSCDHVCKSSKRSNNFNGNHGKFYTSPNRCYPKYSNKKRTKIPPMRSKSADIYRRGRYQNYSCEKCHPSNKTDLTDDIIMELPRRLANSLPRNSPPHSPVERCCRTEQLQRKFH